MNLRRVGALSILATLTLAVGVTAPASANVKGTGGRWVFSGTTYGSNNTPPSNSDRNDPMNVVWRGGGLTYNVKNVMAHTEDHWRERLIPPGFFGGKRMKRRTTNFICTDAKYVFMSVPNSSRQGNMAASKGYMLTNGACTNQYHIRLWDSQDHALAGRGGAYEHQFEWVLAGIHHEKAKASCGLAPTFPFPYRCHLRRGHTINMSFDTTRYIYTRVMSDSHCVRAKWAVHPQSRGFVHSDLRDNPGVSRYSGIMSRVSLRHRSEGCNGA